MPTFTRKPGSAKSRSLKPLQHSHFASADAVGLHPTMQLQQQYYMLQ